MKNTIVNVPVAGFAPTSGILRITPDINCENITESMCQGYAIRIVKLLRVTLPDPIYHEVVDQINNWDTYHPYSDKDILDYEERIAESIKE